MQKIVELSKVNLNANREEVIQYLLKENKPVLIFLLLILMFGPYMKGVRIKIVMGHIWIESILCLEKLQGND